MMCKPKDQSKLLEKKTRANEVVLMLATTTTDGFHSWMFRGLGFVLPFLFAGYVFQLYNSYVLFKLWREQRCQAEWQIVALCGLFCFVALGNAWTTFAVVYNKYTGRDKPGRRRRLQTKYSLDMTDPVMKKDT